MMLPIAPARVPRMVFRISAGVLASLLAALVPFAILAQEPAGAVDFGALEKALKQAMAGPQPDSGEAIVQQLAETGDPRAAEIIIQHALTGASYAVEKAAGAALLSLDSPAVRAKVLEGTDPSKNPKLKSRIVLLAVTAIYAEDDPAALTALAAGLKDPAKPIVLSVIKALRKLARLETVPAFIEAVEAREKKPHDRVYMDLQRALTALTGAELEFAADWKNYWDVQKGAKRPPKRPTEGLTAVSKKPKFFSVPVDSNRVLFIIDISKSMLICDPELPTARPREEPKVEEPKSGGTTVVGKPKQPAPVQKKAVPDATRERLARVKAELIRVINSLEPTTRFGILSFNHQLAWWGDGKAVLKDGSSANKSNAVSWVRGLVAEGATRTDLALESALSLSDIDTIYLLTDGSPKDEHGQKIDFEPILERTKEANRFMRSRIHTISFAQIVDARMVALVKQLAAQNDGVCTMLP